MNKVEASINSKLQNISDTSTSVVDLFMFLCPSVPVICIAIY